MSREGAGFVSTVGAESPTGQAEAVAGDECERAWEASWGGVGVGCRGPAPADPGYSKERRPRRLFIC